MAMRGGTHISMPRFVVERARCSTHDLYPDRLARLSEVTRILERAQNGEKVLPFIPGPGWGEGRIGGVWLSW